MSFLIHIKANAKLNPYIKLMYLEELWGAVA